MQLTFALLVCIALACVVQEASSQRASTRRVSPRILNGKDAPDGKYPYQVSLRWFGSHSCGGSIIDEKNVLTAAHCIQRREKIVQYLKIQTGSNSLRTGGEFHDVASVTVHKDFSSSQLINDIAIVHLKNPLKFGPKVQPIKLSTNDTGVEGKDCKLTGWGSNKLGGETPDKLQEIDVLIYSRENCSALHSKVRDSHICTVTKSREGACQGDSGGPLVADGFQIGIVSFGRQCVIGYPNVYTAVSSFLDWIAQNKKK